VPLEVLFQYVVDEVPDRKTPVARNAHEGRDLAV